MRYELYLTTNNSMPKGQPHRAARNGKKQAGELTLHGPPKLPKKKTWVTNRISFGFQIPYRIFKNINYVFISLEKKSASEIKSKSPSSLDPLCGRIDFANVCFQKTRYHAKSGFRSLGKKTCMFKIIGACGERSCNPLPKTPKYSQNI